MSFGIADLVSGVFIFNYLFADWSGIRKFRSLVSSIDIISPMRTFLRNVGGRWSKQALLGLGYRPQV